MAVYAIDLNLEETPVAALSEHEFQELLKIYEALKRLRGGLTEVAALINNGGGIKEVYRQNTFPAVSDVSLLFLTDQFPGFPEILVPYIYVP